MRFIYLDSAGNQGTGGSRFMVFGFLSTPNPQILEKCVKQTREKFGEKKNELKFTNSTPAQREHLLTILSKENIEIAYTYVDKKQYGTRNLSIYAASMGIPPNGMRRKDYGKIILTIDKGDIPPQAQDILCAILPTRNGRAIKDIKIIDSRDDKGLQAVDFVVGAIFHKYEKQDNRYYSIIESKIKERILLRP